MFCMNTKTKVHEDGSATISYQFGRIALTTEQGYRCNVRRSIKNMEKFLEGKKNYKVTLDRCRPDPEGYICVLVIRNRMGYPICWKWYKSIPAAQRAFQTLIDKLVDIRNSN